MKDIPVLKVLLLGDGGVGKTSLSRRFCEGRFDQSRVMTIGVDFQIKIVDLFGVQIKLSIWDMAGQPRFQSIRQGFYRGGLAAALVYDMGNIETLKSLSGWYKEAIKNAPEIKFMIVGNKEDQSRANEKLGEHLASMMGVLHVRTSAATGSGVDEMFGELTKIARSRISLDSNSASAQ